MFTEYARAPDGTPQLPEMIGNVLVDFAAI
jgi:hypothetical protein